MPGNKDHCWNSLPSLPFSLIYKYTPYRHQLLADARSAHSHRSVHIYDKCNVFFIHHLKFKEKNHVSSMLWTSRIGSSRSLFDLTHAIHADLISVSHRSDAESHFISHMQSMPIWDPWATQAMQNLIPQTTQEGFKVGWPHRSQLAVFECPDRRIGVGLVILK